MADTPREDLTGREYNSWTVLEYAGRVRSNGNTWESWKCRCKCGNIVVVNKFNLIKDRSKQCLSCSRKQLAEKRGDGRTRSRHYNLWRDNVYGDCCRAWRDPFVFYDWFRASGNGRNLIKKNPSKPHSPLNSYRSSQNRNGIETRRKVLEWMMAKGMSKERAIKKLDSISHQRLYQLHNMSRGLCSNCSEPLDNARHCKRHAQEALERGRMRRRGQWLT